MRVPRRLPTGTDAALGAALAVAGVTQAVLTEVSATGRVSAALWALALTSPVALRRRLPVTVMVTLLALGSAHALLVSTTTPFGADVLALLVAFYSAATHAPLRGSSLAVLLALVVFWSQDAMAGHPPSEYFASVVLVLGPWLAGIVVRRTRAQNARLASALTQLRTERDARAHDAVLAERARIARDLHDVVGHGLSVITLQAEAADAALASDPARVRAPVATILATTHATMVEMRRLVSVLGADETTPPTVGLGGLADLVRAHRETGLWVTLEMSEPRGLVPAGVEVATYRIVQEALTNVRRHSRATTADVRLTTEGVWLRVEVVDPGPVGPPSAIAGGFGLAGATARAASCGGRVDAGPHGTGWRLVADLAITAVLDAAGRRVGSPAGA